jgi:hypothetical protein
VSIYHLALLSFSLYQLALPRMPRRSAQFLPAFSSVACRVLDLGPFLAERQPVPNMGLDSEHEGEFSFRAWSFLCKTQTEGNKDVSLTLDLTEELDSNSEGNFSFQMTARDGARVVSQKKTSTGGISFVWVPDCREVMDVRVYVHQQCHGLGYGHLITSFVKAFFFLHRSNAMPEGEFALPLGDYRGIETLTVLPVTGQAKRFYAKQNFVPDPLKLRNKWVFQPQLCPDSFALEPATLTRVDCEAILLDLFSL